MGLIATVLVLFRVVSTADPGGVPADGRAWGLWLALLSVIGVVASAWWATRLRPRPGSTAPRARATADPAGPGPRDTPHLELPRSC